MNNNHIFIIGPSIHMGGMQRAIVNLANFWANSGKKVHLILLFKLDHFFELNSSVHLVEPPEISNTYSKFRRLLFLLDYIKFQTTKLDPKCILVFGRYYSALTVFALRNTEIKVIISDRASPLYKDNIFAHSITKIIFSLYKPTASIAQTSISSDFQKKMLGPSVLIEVVPNAVRTIKKYDVNKKNKVLAVGRFGDKNKGFDLLAEAWSKIPKNDWELIFAGGNEEDAVRTGIDKILSKKLNINPVTYLGKIKDIDLLLNEASIFVMPSRSEGFPNALLEAMTAKTACISFNFIAGASDLIQNDVNGLLVAPENVNELAKALIKLMNNKELRDKLAVNNNYEHNHSVEIIGNKIFDFLSKFKS